MKKVINLFLSLFLIPFLFISQTNKDEKPISSSNHTINLMYLKPVHFKFSFLFLSNYNSTYSKYIDLNLQFTPDTVDEISSVELDEGVIKKSFTIDELNKMDHQIDLSTCFDDDFMHQLINAKFNLKVVFKNGWSSEVFSIPYNESFLEPELETSTYDGISQTEATLVFLLSNEISIKEIKLVQGEISKPIELHPKSGDEYRVLLDNLLPSTTYSFHLIIKWNDGYSIVESEIPLSELKTNEADEEKDKEKNLLWLWILLLILFVIIIFSFFLLMFLRNKKAKK